MSMKRCSICNAELELVNDRMICKSCKAEYMVESYSWEEMPTEFRSSNSYQGYDAVSFNSSNQSSNSYQEFDATRYDSSNQSLNSYQEFDATRYDSSNQSLNPYQEFDATRYDSPNQSLNSYQEFDATRYDSLNQSSNSFQEMNLTTFDSAYQAIDSYQKSDSYHSMEDYQSFSNYDDFLSVGANSYNVTPSEMPKDMSHKKRILIILAIIGAFFLYGMINVLWIGHSLGKNNVYENQSSGKEQGSITSNDVQEDSAQSSDASEFQTPSSITIAKSIDTSLVEGTMIEELITEAFACKASEVTDEQLEMVLEVSVKKDGYGHIMVGYVLSDGTEKEYMTTFEKIDGGLCAIFPKIQKIDIETDYIQTKYLTNLRDLDTIYAKFDGNPTEYVNVDKIQELGIYSGTSYVEDLVQFTNLHTLSIEISGSKGMSTIAKMGNIKKLTLETSGGFDDFSELYNMTQLEALYIKSSQLKEIGFVKNMPNLTEFGLEETSVVDISPLSAYENQLTKLVMIENYKIPEYSLVCNMTNLEELHIIGSDGSFDIPMPDLSKCTKLRSLTIHDYGYIDSLECLVNLEELTLHHILADDISQIRALTNLKKLTCYNCSFENENIQDIVSLSNLEYLDMNDSFVFGDMTDLFKMENLKYLNLYSASGGIDLTRFEVNESLTFMNMEKVRFCYLKDDNTWNWGDSVDIEWQDFIGICENFTNLEYLMIPNNSLSNIECLKSLKSLEILDIRDTYITDLSPLVGAPLRGIYSERTPLVEKAGFEDILIKD